MTNNFNVSISVIIPLYNKEDLIKNCVLNTLKQTVLPLEIIVINDGSTDHSIDYLKSVVNQNKNGDLIKIFNQKNQGVSNARNNGIKLARGEFIAFLDADDEWDKDYLAEMSRLISSYPEASIYSCNNFFVHNHESSYLCYSKLPKGFHGYINDYFKRSRREYLINSSKVIVKKHIINAVGGFPESAYITEDLYVWFKIVSIYKFAYLNKPLVKINRFRDNSRDKRIYKNIYILSYFNDNPNEFKALDAEKKGYLYSVYFIHVLGSLKDGKYKEAYYRVIEGIKLFKLKGVFLFTFFLLPPFVFKALRVIRRKI